MLTLWKLNQFAFQDKSFQFCTLQVEFQKLSQTHSHSSNLNKGLKPYITAMVFGYAILIDIDLYYYISPFSL